MLIFTISKRKSYVAYILYSLQIFSLLDSTDIACYLLNYIQETSHKEIVLHIYKANKIKKWRKILIVPKIFLMYRTLSGTIFLPKTVQLYGVGNAGQ